MSDFVASIGSNVEGREQMLSEALRWLSVHYQALAVSEIYDTHAINGRDPDYLNAVMVCRCDDALTMSAVNDSFKDYERQCGRTPDCKSLGCVPIDLDIVVWAGEVVRDKDFNCDFFRKGWDQVRLYLSEDEKK